MPLLRLYIGAAEAERITQPLMAAHGRYAVLHRALNDDVQKCVWHCDAAYDSCCKHVTQNVVGLPEQLPAHHNSAKALQTVVCTLTA